MAAGAGPRRINLLAKTKTPGRTFTIFGRFLSRLKSGVHNLLSMSVFGKLRCSIEPHTQRPVWAVLNICFSSQAGSSATPPHGGFEPILTDAALRANVSLSNLFESI